MLRRALALALSLAGGLGAALAVAACSTHAFAGRSAGGTAKRAAHAAKTTGMMSTAARTATAPSEQQVTEVQTTTTHSATTTAPSPGSGHPVIQLGDENTTEQFILGDLYALALRHDGYTVVINPNIGTPEVSQAALQQGSLMVYPEYLNVWDREIAHDSRTFMSRAAALDAGQRYARRHRWELLAPTPFSNTDGVAVSAQYARLNGVRSLTDLSRGPGLTLGWPPESSVQQELAQVESAYDFTPASAQPIAIGSQYDELSDNTIQAAFVYTTDPQLTEPDYTLLRDPLHIFGFGNVVPVTTDKVIKEEGPMFVATIDQVSALLTQSAIRGLSYEVTIEHQDPTAVAEQFLQGNGILPATRYAPLPKTNTTGTSTTGTGASMTGTGASATGSGR